MHGETNVEKQILQTLRSLSHHLTTSLSWLGRYSRNMQYHWPKLKLTRRCSKANNLGLTLTVSLQLLNRPALQVDKGSSWSSPSTSPHSHLSLQWDLILRRTKYIRISAFLPEIFFTLLSLLMQYLQVTLAVLRIFCRNSQWCSVV